MNKKTWIIFAVICVAVLGGLIAFSRKDSVNVSDIDQAKQQTASAANGNIADHVFGKADSKVTLIEYGDFQCPYCGQAHPQVKSVTEAYKDKIAFVFRNYPLPTMHPNAKAAAAAVEAAGLQGKYWEMNNKIYETQNDWNNLSTDKRTDIFVSFAKAVGVKDAEKFKADMSSQDVNKKINFDLALGNKAQVTGTPSFYLNGTKVTDEVSSSIINGDGSKLREALDNLLK